MSEEAEKESTVCIKTAFMHIQRWLNTAGLGLGLLGVTIVWWWGFPQPSFDKGLYLALEGGPMVEQHDAQVSATERHYRHMSEAGMALIVAGFVCQLLNELGERFTERRNVD